MRKTAHEKVLVLDFGSQYAQLIARRVRQQHTYCEIVRHDIAPGRIREIEPKGLILFWGAVQRLRRRGAEMRSRHL